MGWLGARALLGAVLAAPLVAQSTWVVDASGGSGSHFTTIGAALAAASDGDVILVRPGIYAEAPSTGKAVHVIGQRGVLLSQVGGTGFTVTGIGAGKAFTLQGVAFAQTAHLAFRHCAGRLHLADLNVSTIAFGANRFEVEDCRQVTLTRVAAQSYPALILRQSRVVLEACELTGTLGSASTPALIADESDVTVVDGRLTGGWGLTASAPAVLVEESRLTLAGLRCTVAAGGFGSPPVPAVVTRSGEVVVEPAVTLTPHGGAPPISGPATVSRRRIASVRNDIVLKGGWLIYLHAPAGSAFCVLAGAPRLPLATPFGELWVAERNHAIVACGVMSSVENSSVCVPLPALPPGTALVSQAVLARNGAIELSTPAVKVIE